MTTTTSPCIGNIIMSTLSCQFYEGQNAPLSGKYRVDYLRVKMHPYQVSIGLITCISPLNCQYILSSSFESHGSPKHLVKKLIQIKTSIFERAKIKVH